MLVLRSGVCYTVRYDNRRHMGFFTGEGRPAAGKTSKEEDLFMANRVVISICGEDYTFVAEESAAYMEKVGNYVSAKMNEVLSSAKVGRIDAAVLTAANITDELFKSQAAAEQLRGQIKEYLDEAGKAQAEASELKREVFRLQQKLDQMNKNGNRG